MSYIHKLSNNKSYHNKKIGFKGKSKNMHEKIKNNKGNWEFNIFQKRHDSTKEAKIKKDLHFVGGFNPTKIDDMMNPPLSKEDIIEEKIKKNQKLSSTEEIIYNNIKTKKKESLEKDLDYLKRFKLNATVMTEEGKLRKLMNTLEHVMSKGNNDVSCLIYLKLKDQKFKMCDKLKKEYSFLLQKLERVVSQCDLIKMQMTTLHSNQPPLDAKGFTKLDDFQVEVINNINNNISTLVSAPTSSGKSVISGYCFTKGRVLVIVPTDVLAWQMSAYIENIIGSHVPIITKSFQSSPKRDELIESVNKSNALVGTADSILDFLPLITLKFEWIIFDEIHMIGRSEGSSMEHIARLYPNVPFLGLSATIDNIEGLKSWFQTFSDKPINIVKCDKRFFNLQKYVWDNSMEEIIRIHPLSIIDASEFKDGSILRKNMNPTPPDIWDLATTLEKEFDMGPLKTHTFFNSEIRITLDMSNNYFEELLKFMVKNYKGDGINKINNILSKYQNINFSSDYASLFKLLMKLKKDKKCPAIIFQENSTSCMRLVRQFAKDIETNENTKYPTLFSEREKSNKQAKKLEKKNEKNKVDEIGDKKFLKMLMHDDNSKAVKIEEVKYESVQEPHRDFIFNEDQLFTSTIVDSWAKDLSTYFPNSFGEYHWLIIMLWRGVGVYVKGLPDPYLRLVQSLASSKKLAVVFSDSSLVFGVSMPFRTTVIFRDIMIDDTLNSMMYHQMAGRAGRRGLDKEGNVIFANYTWSRIKELSISSYPVVEGRDTMVYTVDNAIKLSTNGDIINWNNIKSNFFHPNITNTIASEFYNDINENCSKDGGWEFMNKTCKNFNFMVWQLRNDIDSITIPLIIPELLKSFDTLDPNKEKDQVDLALFLSHFINLEESTETNYILQESEYLQNGSSSELKNACDNLGIEIPTNICSKVYMSINNNKLINQSSEKNIDLLRDKIFKFSEKIRHLQHYFFHTKQVTITRLIGKLLTRIWWIYHTSSPLMKSWNSYEEEINMNVYLENDNDSDNDADNDSDYESGNE